MKKEICTKMPIRFEMVKTTDGSHNISARHRNFSQANITPDSILTGLTEYMDGMKEIVEEEMVIEIRSHHVMTFTIIDLPGIRSYPAEAATATTNLAKRYLSDSNTLVLCVVPATDTRLTSSTAIGMVLQHGRQAQSILTLTMPDRIASTRDFQTLVVNRITGKSDELSNCNFAACVTVKNRTEEEQDLEKSYAAELEYFEKAFQPWKDEHEAFATITSNAGVDKLLSAMDQLYHSFIINNWKPRALEQLAKVRQDLKEQVDTLGPENAVLADIIFDVKRQIEEQLKKKDQSMF